MIDSSYTTDNIASIVRETRKRMGITQREMALAAGAGVRFVIDLEKGKPSCQIGKVLAVLETLGIVLELRPPSDSAAPGAIRDEKP